MLSGEVQMVFKKSSMCVLGRQVYSRHKDGILSYIRTCFYNIEEYLLNLTI